MGRGRLLAYRMVVLLIGAGMGIGLKTIWPGLSKNEMLLYGMPILFVLIVLLPMRFEALRAPPAD